MRGDLPVDFDLIAPLKTTREVADFISEIDKFVSEDTLDSISESSARKIRQIFLKNNLDINDKSAVAGFFGELKDIMGKLKIIKLTLAFDPSYKTLEKIHNFVNDIAGAGYIFEIEVSPELLGGAIIVFGGKYYDFTLKKHIEDTFANKNEILGFIQ